MIRTYDEQFVARMKDFAVLGLGPEQIAERMELAGDERRDFLFAITQDNHPIRIAYLEARQHHEDDLDAALETVALSGDASALDLAFRVRKERRYEQVLNELFGI